MDVGLGANEESTGFEVPRHTLSAEGARRLNMDQGRAPAAEPQIDGSEIVVRSSYTQHGARLNYTFRGMAQAKQMEGSLLVGEYGTGRWSAKRHEHQFPQGGRPIPG